MTIVQHTDDCQPRRVNLDRCAIIIEMIDLQRVFRPKVWPSRWLIKDLAALNYSTPAHVASRTDRLRWLQQYLDEREKLRQTGSDEDSLKKRRKRLAIQIAGKTRQIAKHDERRKARAMAPQPLRGRDAR